MSRVTPELVIPISDDAVEQRVRVTACRFHVSSGGLAMPEGSPELDGPMLEVHGTLPVAIHGARPLRIMLTARPLPGLEDLIFNLTGVVHKGEFHVHGNLDRRTDFMALWAMALAGQIAHVIVRYAPLPDHGAQVEAALHFSGPEGR